MLLDFVSDCHGDYIITGKRQFFLKRLAKKLTKAV